MLITTSIRIDSCRATSLAMAAMSFLLSRGNIVAGVLRVDYAVRVTVTMPAEVFEAVAYCLLCESLMRLQVARMLPILPIGNEHVSPTPSDKIMLRADFLLGCAIYVFIYCIFV